MPNNLALAGSNPGKQTKRSAMWNARFWDGLYTQKGALRDVAPRQEEKFYGARGDSLIDGSNVEITSKLTLARRFGNSIWNSNEWSNIDSFYEFRLFNSNTEEIKTIVDTSSALYNASNNGQVKIWSKNPNAGQSYMQSVGNTLFWGDGVDRKKWINTLQSRTPYVQTAVAQNPYNFTPYELDTFVVDSNNNAQQLIETVLQLSGFYILNGTVVFSMATGVGYNLPKAYEILEPGLQVNFSPSSQFASAVGESNGLTLTVQDIVGGLTSASIYFGGAGYTVNDIVNVNQTTPAGSLEGQVKVTSVGTSAGSGYTSGLATTTTTGQGVGATLNVTAVSGGLVSAAVTVGGAGYSIGDFVIPQQNSGSNGYFKVTSVSSGVITAVSLATGSVTSATIYEAGSGYYAASNVPTTGGTGKALALTIVDNQLQFSCLFPYSSNGLVTSATGNLGGPITSATVSAGGTGYLLGELLVPSQPSQTKSSGGVLQVSSISGGVAFTGLVSEGPSVTAYTTGIPTWTTSGTGTGAAFNITSVSGGMITGISTTSGGTGFSVGDLIYVTQGSASGAVISVLTVSGSAIATTSILTGGLTGYTVATGVATTTSGSGTGFTINITGVSSGKITSYTIATAGSGYNLNDLIYVTQGSASGAILSVLELAGGVVTGLSVPSFGTGYPVNVTMPTTTNNVGTGCTIQISYNPLLSSPYYVTIISGGDGYNAEDTIVPTYTGASGFSSFVSTTSPYASSISSLTVYNGGINYVTQSGLTTSLLVSSEVGSGAVANIVVSNENYFPFSGISDIVPVYSGGNPISDSRSNATFSLQWSTVEGNTTIDGSALWVNRGSTVNGGLVYNWGMDGGTIAPTVVVNNAVGGWAANTYYNQWNFIVVTVGSNKYIQSVYTAGKSGSSAPSWSTVVGQNTTDGTATWVCVANDADTSLAWAASQKYTPGHVLESGAGNVMQLQPYTGIMTQGNIPAYCWQCYNDQVGSDLGAAGEWFNGSSNAAMSQNGGQSLSTATYSGSVNNLFLVAEGGSNKVASPTITGDGTVSSTTTQLFPASESLNIALLPQLIIPAPGVYTFNIGHQVAMFWGVGNGSLDLEVVSLKVRNGVLTATCNQILTNTLSTGVSLDFSGFSLSNWINGTTAVVTSVSGKSFTANVTQANYGPISDTGMAATVGTLTPTVVSGPMNWITGGSPNSYNFSTGTPINGYPIMSANYPSRGKILVTDTVQISFPSAGVYPAEIHYGVWYHSTTGFTTPVTSPPLPSTVYSFYMTYTPPGRTTSYNIIPQSLACSSLTSPTFPAWPSSVTALQALSPAYPSVLETSGNFTWYNLGPVSQFSWNASVNYTPQTFIIDANSNEEIPYEPGVSGSTVPTFDTILYGLTTDIVTTGSTGLIWENAGPEGSSLVGTLSASEGGFGYCVAVVNTLDDTVSNASIVSTSTGNFFEATGIYISGGLPGVVDPQADYVAIFRTNDGGASYYLIPPPQFGNGNTEYTLPLSTYIAQGFTDTTLDSGLNVLLQAPLALQNTRPKVGTINLTYTYGRLFTSIGNTVYWSTGPDTPIGNGLNGFAPNNYAEFPSLVVRIVPVNPFTIVFTVSDIYVITGNGEVSSPFTPQNLLQRVGLLSYNALAINGSVIYFMSTDNQVIEFNPHGGVGWIGQPIADLLTEISPKDAYLTWHTSGYQDQALFVADGSTGWYKMLPTIPPEIGMPWCPKANIMGGCGCVQSTETSPGNIQLLLGPPPGEVGPILFRDYSTYSDNGVPYEAFFTFDSIVLAHPGQVAAVEFITADSAKFLGAVPLTIGILIGEISGEFEQLTQYVNDPPQLQPSLTLNSQRFYLLQGEESIECRHMQIRVNWIAQNFADEIISLSPFGGFSQES